MKKTLQKAIIFIASILCGVNISAQTVLKVGDEWDISIDMSQKNYQEFSKKVLQNKSASKEERQVIYEKEFFSENSSYVKLYFENFDLAKGDYLEITSVNTGESIIYGGLGKIIDKSGNTISNFWSRVMLDDKVTVKLYSYGDVGAHKGFEITKVAYGYSEAKIKKQLLASASQKSICSSDNKESIACYEGTEMFEKANAVCRLLIGGSSLCTGWLLGSEGNLMTNNHCIGSSTDALNTDFMFNYQYSNCSETSNATSDIVASSATFIKTSSSLDYTLVQLPVNPTGTYGYLSLSSTIPSAGDRIYIPQHPGGRRKEISVTTDSGGTSDGFSSVFDTNLSNSQSVRYLADTEGGSSGSPVIDYDSNLVIAIHNTGGCPNGSYGRCDELISSIGSDMPNNGVDDSYGGGGGTPTCDDGIQNGDETGVDCGGSSCAPCICESEGAYTLDITLDNYPEETSWEVTSGGSTVASGSYSTANADGSSVTETFTLTSGDYQFTIYDAYGDGICCSYGNGSYSLSSPDGVVVSGGSFGSSETTTFCVDGGGSSVFPDTTKKYYIDNDRFNLRLAATGESEDPYTTSQSTTGDDVEWQFVDKGNGYWHLDRAAGGTTPRLRTDNSEFADMQATGWSGIYTYYSLTDSNSVTGAYYLTLPDGPTSYRRLQITNTGDVKMVSESSQGSWVSFRITEVAESVAIEPAILESETISSITDIILAPNPIKKGYELQILGIDNSSDASFSVINILGQTVKEGILKESKSISIDEMKSGVYMLQLETESMKTTKRFIVE